MLFYVVIVSPLLPGALVLLTRREHRSNVVSDTGCAAPPISQVEYNDEDEERRKLIMKKGCIVVGGDGW